MSDREWPRFARLGFRTPRLFRADPPPRTVDTATTFEREEGGIARVLDPGESATLGFVSMCTRSHLAMARTLFDGLRRYHPEAALVLCLVDDQADADLSGDLPGVTILRASDLRVPRFHFLALKYSATDLCCALKPFAIRHLLAHTSLERVIYIDADMCVYARLDALTAPLDDADFVVTPHVMSPFPASLGGTTRPSLGDLAMSGVLNAGVFSLRRGDASDRFLATWCDLVTAPGAFDPSLGGQTEQHAFNWILTFVERVVVLRNPAYNVSYWNLHERSVRWNGHDGDAGAWSVNGRPLACFHFSGFTPDEPFRLSHFDHRYAVPLLFSVSRLLQEYTERLLENGWARCSALGYGFDRFPSGIPIDDRLRRVFKDAESWLRTDINPFTEDGEEYFCQAALSPMPCYPSLLPAVLYRIRGERPDLQFTFPDADVKPEPLVQWLVNHGRPEGYCRELFNRHRPVVPSSWMVAKLHTELESTNLIDGLSRPLTAEREQLIDRLLAAGRRDLLQALEACPGEVFVHSIMGFLLHAYESRTDLATIFPDVLGSDADRFAGWLSTYGVDEFVLTPKVEAVFRRCAKGGSLARIFSLMNRTPWLMEHWPLALIGEGRYAFARALLAVLRDGLELDTEDVVTYLWIMERRPWTGLELTIELAGNLARSPSSRLPEGQAQLFAAQLNDPVFRHALDAYQRQFADPESAAEHQWLRRWAGSCAPQTSAVEVMTATFKGRATGAEHRGGGEAGGVEASPRLGANVFGYFKSPIGLGEFTRGLAGAMRSAGIEVRENVVGNVAMDTDLSPSDFVRRFDYRQSLNVFVSYPHLETLLLRSYPPWMIEGRTNIAHLAWEQRDGGAHWREMYQRFDQVWAISGFAARSLETHLRRPVQVVNCVVDTATLPPRAAKGEAGLAADRFTFLYVFDANSSIERKHPESALRAFKRAFGRDEPVRLCLKIANAHRVTHRERLHRIIDLCHELGPRVQLVMENYGRRQILGLISAADCYVSLHRTEGFGFTCAEAMAYGRPVIATRYSGNLDFMTDRNSFLVDAREVEVEYPEGPFQRGSVWAEADVEHAAACMRTVYEQPADAKRRGDHAALDIRRLLSPEAIGQQIAGALSASANKPRLEAQYSAG